MVSAFHYNVSPNTRLTLTDPSGYAEQDETPLTTQRESLCANDTVRTLISLFYGSHSYCVKFQGGGGVCEIGMFACVYAYEACVCAYVSVFDFFI